MEKISFYLPILAGLLLISCAKNADETVVPTKQVVAIDAQTLALIDNLKGSWDTDLVRDNGILVYTKSDKKLTSVDYSKFKLELYGNFDFKMTDKDNNTIEGIWYVTKDSKLYLDYLKRDFSVPAIAALCEHSCAGVVTVTISFDLKGEMTKDNISIENDKVEYQMTHDGL